MSGSGVQNNGAVTLPKASATDIAKHLRVKLDAGLIVIAGAADLEAGTYEYGRVGETKCTVLPLGFGTVRRFVAAAAIASGAAVYGAAGGKITSTQPGTQEPIGWATIAASGDNSIITVLMAYPRTMV